MLYAIFTHLFDNSLDRELKKTFAADLYNVLFLSNLGTDCLSLSSLILITFQHFISDTEHLKEVEVV